MIRTVYLFLDILLGKYEPLKEAKALAFILSEIKVLAEPLIHYAEKRIFIGGSFDQL